MVKKNRKGMKPFLDLSLFPTFSKIKKQRFILSLLDETMKKNYSIDEFFSYYAQLTEIGALEKFVAPRWLDAEEKLAACFSFHSQFDPYSAGKNLGAVAIDKNNDNLKWNPRHDVHIVLDRVRNAYNLGAIIRLVDNFGFAGVIHNLEKLSIRQKTCRKAAQGAENWIPVNFDDNLEQTLGNRTKPLIVIEDDFQAIPLSQWKPPKDCYLLAGNESFGVSTAFRSLSDGIVFLDAYGFKKSMNVSISIAIVAAWIVNHHKSLPE